MAVKKRAAVERKREGEWEVGEGEEEEEVPPDGGSEKEGKGEFLPMAMGGSSCQCRWAV